MTTTRFWPCQYELFITDLLHSPARTGHRGVEEGAAGRAGGGPTGAVQRAVGAHHHRDDVGVDEGGAAGWANGAVLHRLLPGHAKLAHALGEGGAAEIGDAIGAGARQWRGGKGDCLHR